MPAQAVEVEHAHAAVLDPDQPLGLQRMQRGVPQANGTTMVEPRMHVDSVARAIVYMDSLPLDANVQFITVMATQMPYVGRG